MRLQQLLALALGPLGVPLAVCAQTPGSFEPAGAGIPLFRPSGTVAVVARATATWVPVPTDSHDLLGAYQFLPPYATDDTEGQVFDLVAAEPGWQVPDPSGQFVAVPWTVGCGCAEEGWDGTAWVPPGDTVTFLLSKTRKRVPRGGLPVYDVLGWHQPYPVGEFIPYWRSTREEPMDWLTAEEFFGLLQALPAESAFQLDPTSSLHAVQEWLDGNPDRSDAFPVPTILRELNRFTEGG